MFENLKKCNKCGADLWEGVFMSCCMGIHKECTKCKNIITLKEMNMNCEHIYKPVVLNKEEWISIDVGSRGAYSFSKEPKKNISQTFYLYCEKCGDIINNYK